MKTPRDVRYLTLETTCVQLSKPEWDKLMAGATRADTRLVNRLVHKHLPELWYALSLNMWNPYHYYKTARHLVLVHSGIEHFLAYAV